MTRSPRPRGDGPRGGGTTPSGRFRFGPFELDPRRRVLEGPSGPVELQPKVFDLLCYLVRNPERAVTKDELLEALWDATVVTESALTRAVRALRVALGDDAADPHFVRALRGVGYRFVAPVEQSAHDTEGTLTLAVFPFRSVGTEARDEALELGLADTLIAHLSRLPELVVRPLSSAQACLAAAGDPAAAAVRLGVDTYLEASLQIRGERLRVNARLMQVQDGASLWSESLDQHFADVFELQDALGARIVARLAPHVGADAPPAHPAAATPEAYRLFLEGRLFKGRHTSADVRAAAERFERALDLAPAYGEAWAALGECHELLATEGERDAAGLYASARRAADRALALTPHLPEADCLAARVAWQFDWDWARADAIFLAALERHPNRGDLHIDYSDFLSCTGRHAESIAHARRAVELDPVSPWFNTLLAQALYMAERFDEARDQAAHAVELAPDFSFARFFNGLAHFFSGERERGLDELRSALRSGRRDFLGTVALCAGLAGRLDEAHAILKELRQQSGTPPFALALACLGVGDSTAALEQFERCLDQRDWHVLLLAHDPMFAAFREQADGARLIERIRPA